MTNRISFISRNRVTRGRSSCISKGFGTIAYTSDSPQQYDVTSVKYDEVKIVRRSVKTPLEF